MSAPASVLLVLDFDGTITDADGPDELARHFDAENWHATEAMLDRGELSAAEAVARELAPVALDEDAALAFLLERARPRPGLAALLSRCSELGWEAVVLSDGVRAYAEAFLRAHEHDELRVDAHRVRFSPGGTTVELAGLARCPVCGTTCKRPRMLRLAGGRPVVYVGDGLSDRCAALAARTIFARAGLADHLAARSVAYVPFSTLDDVAARLPDGA